MGYTADTQIETIHTCDNVVCDFVRFTGKMSGQCQLGFVVRL